MKPRTVVLALIFVVALFDFGVAQGVGHPFSLASATFLSGLLAQAGLHAVWVAVGTRPWLLRYASLLPAAGAFWWSLRMWGQPSAIREFVPIYIAVIVITIGSLTILRRVFKFQLWRSFDVESPGDTRLAAVQFSIQDMLKLTALVGVATALATQIATVYRVGEYFVLGLVSIPIGLVPLLSVLATMTVRHRGRAMALLLVLIAGAGLAIDNLFLRAPGGFVLTSLLLGNATIELFVLFQMRRHGYRFGRCRAVASPGLSGLQQPAAAGAMAD